MPFFAIGGSCALPDLRHLHFHQGIEGCANGIEVAESQLNEFLQGRLARFKIPRRYEFSSDPLPKTGTGKIRKMVIKERFWVGKEKRVQG